MSAKEKFFQKTIVAKITGHGKRKLNVSVPRVVILCIYLHIVRINPSMYIVILIVYGGVLNMYTRAKNIHVGKIAYTLPPIVMCVEMRSKRYHISHVGFVQKFVNESQCQKRCLAKITRVGVVGTKNIMVRIGILNAAKPEKEINIVAAFVVRMSDNWAGYRIVTI